MTKNKKPLILIGIVALIILIGGWLMSGYNDMVKLDENVNREWSQVENQYQRRLDLIPNLVSVVKGYASQKYPDLKATDNFKQLQAQLEGTENRITLARKDYNDAATIYNKLVRRFPNNMLAGIFGFSVRPQFKAQEGAESAPAVQF